MRETNYKIPGVELSDKIARFIYENRKALLKFLIVAFFIHSIPVILNMKLPEKKEIKRPPTTVKFIQKPPRLTKSIEFRKMPTIVERVIQRFVSPQKPRMSAEPSDSLSSYNNNPRS